MMEIIKLRDDQPYDQWDIDWTPELKEQSKAWANSNGAISQSEYRNNPNMANYFAPAFVGSNIEAKLLKEPLDDLEKKIEALNVENLKIQKGEKTIRLTFHNSEASGKKNAMDFGVSAMFPNAQKKIGYFVYDQPQGFYERVHHAKPNREGGQLKFGERTTEFYIPSGKLTLIYHGTWQPQFRKGDFSEKGYHISIDGLIESIELVGQELNSLQKWQQVLKNTYRGKE